MFKFQVHCLKAQHPAGARYGLTEPAWYQVGTFYDLELAQLAARGIGALRRSVAVVISQIWIPRGYPHNPYVMEELPRG